MSYALALVLVLVAMPASAGFVELGASANYRSSTYDKHNYTQSLTHTGSLSYYFWEMCAWELNYTTGYSKQVSKGSSDLDPVYKIEDNIELVSLDLVLSFAGRQDPFRPYIKVGAGYLVKERFRRVNDDETDRTRQEGAVPSGGLGLGIALTKEFSIKFGVEAWTSPLMRKNEPVIVDYAGRAGVAWIF